LLLISSISLWSQVEPAATGGDFDLDDTHMMTPPPVSGDAYPVMVGAEMRSNFLSGGMVVTAAHVDNLLLQNGKGPIADETYSFLPTIEFNRRTPRQGESLNYSSGFTLYQNTSQLNGVSQDASAGYRFHLSRYAVLELHDAFSQNYNFYSQGSLSFGGSASGSPGSGATVLIAPFENQLGNLSSAAIDYQYGRNAMIGGSASYSFLQYSSGSQSQGLNNLNTTGMTGFYSRRIARSEYAGVIYQFSKYITHPIETYTPTHTIFAYYTHYFTESFSLSILAGPEHYGSWTPTSAKQEAWTPAVQGSFGWQTPSWNASATYSHIVSGAGGLIGTYSANMVGANAQLAFSKRWIVSSSGGYATFSNVNSAAISPGHTVSAQASVRHKLLENLSAETGYGYFHQSYGTIQPASFNPDSNRVYVSIAYQFSKPVGR
jgi:hypothetical protein